MFSHAPSGDGDGITHARTGIGLQSAHQDFEFIHGCVSQKLTVVRDASAAQEDPFDRVEAEYTSESKKAPVRGLRVTAIRSTSEGSLFETGGLADLVAQIVELRAANLSTTHGLDLDDLRRMDGECALHADTEGDLAHGEGLTVARTMTTDDHTLEYLDPLAVTFYDAIVDLDVVANVQAREIIADLLLLDGADGVHRMSSVVGARRPSRRRQVV